MIIVGVLTDLVNFRSVAVHIALITEIYAVVTDNRNIKRFHLLGQGKDAYNLHKIVTYFL